MTTQPTGQSLSKRVRRQARAAGQSNDSSTLPGVSPAIVEDLSSTDAQTAPVVIDDRPGLYKPRDRGWEEFAELTIARCNRDLRVILQNKEKKDEICDAASAAMQVAFALLDEHKYKAAAEAAWYARYEAYITILLQEEDELVRLVDPFRAAAGVCPGAAALIERVETVSVDSAVEAQYLRMKAFHLVREAKAEVLQALKSPWGRSFLEPAQPAPLTRTTKAARPRRSQTWLDRQAAQSRFNPGKKGKQGNKKS